MLALTAVLLAVPVAVPAAEGASLATFAGSVPGSLPTRANGEAELLVFSLADQRLVTARTLPRSGRFSLRLPAGGYAVRTSIVDRRASTPSTGLLAVSLRPGQRRAKVALKVRRRPLRRKAKAAYVQESGKSGAGTAVMIEPFTGATGTWAVLNKGLSDMLVTDVVPQIARCKGAVVANSSDRARLQEELDLQKSPAFDPKTRVTRDWVQPDITVSGTLANTGDGLAVTLTLTDSRSGESLGTITGSIAGKSWPADVEKLGKELAKRLCREPQAYQVSLSAQATGEFVAYRATGTAEGLLIARAQDGGEDTPPTSWRSEPSDISWASLSFTSTGLTPCSWTPGSPEGKWGVSIAATGDGMITVTTQGLQTAQVVANAVCPPAPLVIPQEGLALAGLAPESFTLPAGGGSKQVSGSLVAWSHAGTITVRPSAPPQ